ncbi:hypothetical protein EON67_00535 [archaeon]|nr:MAG: hypothetical protein EON67_00535 [archaeon]
MMALLPATLFPLLIRSELRRGLRIAWQTVLNMCASEACAHALLTALLVPSPLACTLPTPGTHCTAVCASTSASDALQASLLIGHRDDAPLVELCGHVAWLLCFSRTLGSVHARRARAATFLSTSPAWPALLPPTAGGALGGNDGGSNSGGDSGGGDWLPLMLQDVLALDAAADAATATPVDVDAARVHSACASALGVVAREEGSALRAASLFSLALEGVNAPAACASALLPDYLQAGSHGALETAVPAGAGVSAGAAVQAGPTAPTGTDVYALTAAIADTAAPSSTAMPTATTTLAATTTPAPTATLAATTTALTAPLHSSCTRAATLSACCSPHASDAPACTYPWQPVRVRVTQPQLLLAAHAQHALEAAVRAAGGWDAGVWDAHGLTFARHADNASYVLSNRVILDCLHGVTTWAWHVLACAGAWHVHASPLLPPAVCAVAAREYAVDVPCPRAGVSTAGACSMSATECAKMAAYFAPACAFTTLVCDLVADMLSGATCTAAAATNVPPPLHAPSSSRHPLPASALVHAALAASALLAAVTPAAPPAAAVAAATHTTSASASPAAPGRATAAAIAAATPAASLTRDTFCPAGARTALTRLLSVLLYLDPAVGDALSRAQQPAYGLAAILAQCKIDAAEPLVREWGLLAVRNGCAASDAVRATIEGFKDVTLASAPELAALGVRGSGGGGGGGAERAATLSPVPSPA